jgi:hypothetical protein
MKPVTSEHLSEEALDDVLIGLGSPEAEAHLAVCELCRHQIKGFQSGVGAFNQASLAWSESKPRTSLQLPAAKAGPAWIPQLTWAMGAVVLLLIGASVWNHNPAVVPENPAVALVQADSETQIAEDNDLLKSINAALSESEASPVQQYGLSDQPRPHRRARRESRSR